MTLPEQNAKVDQCEHEQQDANVGTKKRYLSLTFSLGKAQMSITYCVCTQNTVAGEFIMKPPTMHDPNWA